MFKKKSIQPMIEERPAQPRPGGAVDHISAVTGLVVLGFGIAQPIAPLVMAPITGFEPGIASDVLALQWAALGGLLAVGGLIRSRVVAIFAAEYLVITALAALAVTLIRGPDPVALLMHGTMAFLAFTSSGFARLTDKADLKRELRLLREHAETGNGGGVPLATEKRDA
ncbi:hypothetical protein [Tsuneonella sp. SYSU-LHT278]|uniref:hypothetical protein n=1 Tax=Tsuneonella sediminis TaxID=3416089 RepID=UPI003F78D066